LLDQFGDLLSSGLPKDHGIVMKVRRDGQAWYAWRRTVSGWVFAIGAVGAPPDEWLYDGSRPPVGYPSTRAGWDHFTPAQRANNW
jgi:hypothetical protein